MSQVHSHTFRTAFGDYVVELFVGYTDDLPAGQPGWSATAGTLPGEAVAFRVLARGGRVDRVEGSEDLVARRRAV